MKRKNRTILTLLLCLAVIFSVCSCTSEEGENGEESGSTISSETTADIPEYSEEPYAVLNDNQPEFTDAEITDESFESYSSLDSLGRCGTALCCLSTDTEPAEDEERGNISNVHPSGWVSGMGWQRCHLVGWQLSDENANEKNLVTGSQYMNVSGMLPFENMVSDYIDETGNHVMYRVTPVFEGENLICSGVVMEAYSVEDEGEGICFNVYCYNIMPGAEIDYASGNVTKTDEETVSSSEASQKYVLNTSSRKFHYPSCASCETISEQNKETRTTTRSKLIDEGYSPCGNCNP